MTISPITRTHPRQSRLEDLPPEIIGTICAHLNHITGTEDVLNEKDIPVVMKYVMNLARTSKRMYSFVNDLVASRILINSLSCKYERSPEHFAVVLDTNGARKWLWHQIQENGDLEAYQIIQHIYAMATQARQEVANAGFHLSLHDARSARPDPNPNHCQTQNGIELYGMTSIRHMATPFGDLQIFCLGSATKLDLAVTEPLLRKLNATFQGIQLNERGGKLYECTAQESAVASATVQTLPNVTEIEWNTLASKMSTHSLIFDSAGNPSVYHLGRIAERTIPPVSWPTHPRHARSSELIHRTWDILKIHELGGDPLARKSISSKKPSQVERQMVKYQDLSALSAYGINVVRRIMEQPLTKGPYEELPSKKLIMNHDDARTIELLSTMSRTLSREIMSVSSFDARTTGVENMSGVKCCPPSDSDIDFSSLEQTYQAVLQRVCSRWTPARLRDYPHIALTESEEDYALFIKETPNFPRIEGTFLTFAADGLGISSKIHCDDLWKVGAPYGEVRPIYLWIRKNRLEETMRTLNLH